jgi:chromosome segregation ATPase
LTKDN